MDAEISGCVRITERLTQRVFHEVCGASDIRFVQRLAFQRALCGGRIESEILAETPWINECIGCGGQESQA